MEVYYTVQINAAPHTYIVVKQAVGRCGGNTVYTNYVQINEQDT